jgi:DNA-binding transcriptional LysR family regulator
MDRLAAMRVFTAVADAGSLSAAGRRLNMPLATVSRHLAALEDEIGVRPHDPHHAASCAH